MAGNILVAFVTLALVVAGATNGHGQAYTRPLSDRSFPMTAKQLDSLQSEIEVRLSVTRADVNRDDTAYASLLESLGRCYLGMGQDQRAESLLNLSLDLRVTHLGEKHLDVADALFYLSKCNGEPEKTLRHALAIREEALPNDDLAVAEALDHLAAVMLWQYRHGEAATLVRRAMDIYTKHFTHEDPAWAGLELHLADAHFYANKLLADSLYAVAANRIARAYGTDDIDYAVIVWARSSLEHMRLGRKAEAIANHRRALEVFKRHLRPGSEELFVCAVTLLNKLSMDNHIAEAESTLAYCERLLPYYPERARHAELAQNSLPLFQRTGQFRRALEATWVSYCFHRDMRDQGGAYLNEESLLSYGSSFRYGQNIYLTVFLDLETANRLDTNRAIEALVSGKGWITEAMIRRRRAALANLSPRLTGIMDTIAGLRDESAGLFVRGALADTSNPLFFRFDSTISERKDLERRIAEALSQELAVDSLADSQAVSIARHLPSGSALVEYCRIDYSLNWANPKYAAVVIRPDRSAQVVDLGWSNPIDSVILRHYKPHFDDVIGRRRPPTLQDAEEYRAIASELYGRIWEPLKYLLAGASTVYVAPEGGMNAVSFAALTYDHRFLIEDHAVHYVNAGRDIVRFSSEEQHGEGALIVANPRYRPEQDAQHASGGPSSGGLLESDEWVTRSVSVDCGGVQSLQLDELPGTSREATFIEGALRSSEVEPVTVLADSLAYEETVRSRLRGKRIIHIATHGYAADSRCGPSRLQRRDQFSAGSESSFLSTAPLLMSGLMLSTPSGRDIFQPLAGDRDGVLTAEEVRSVSLDATDLVVLSGCETAQGPSRHSDGVYGLRRAFQFAGVRTVISALWSIPDRETPELMRDIYTSQSADYPRVMREVALKRIAYARENNLPDHPLVWGAFIAVGDWKKSW